MDKLKAFWDLKYKDFWEDMLLSLHGETNDVFCLQSTSGYLFKTAGVKWGMDLIFRSGQIFSQLKSKITEDLKDLKFIIITHAHSDHFDIKLINRLSNLPIKWIIPSFLKDYTLRVTSLQEKNIIWVSEKDKIVIDGITVETFYGLHWRYYFNEGKVGIDALGFLITAGGKRLLFPADVRNYVPEEVPFKENIDFLFQHIWLGRGNSQNYPWQDYLDGCADFIYAIKPKKVFLTHLFDTTRGKLDMWGNIHAGAVMDKLIELAPEIECQIPKTGTSHTL